MDFNFKNARKQVCSLGLRSVSISIQQKLKITRVHSLPLSTLLRSFHTKGFTEARNDILCTLACPECPALSNVVGNGAHISVDLGYQTLK